MAVRICLAWLGALCGALVICLSDALPFTLDFIGPSGLHVALVQCQLAFGLLAWPFLVRPEPSVPRLLLLVGLLEVLALPPALVCANFADAPATAFLRGQALVASVFLFVAALFRVGAARGWERLAPWYVLSVFVLATVFPFLGFLLRELSGTSSAALSFGSPFWAASDLRGPAPLVQALVLGGLAVALLLLDVRGRKGVDAPAPAR